MKKLLLLLIISSTFTLNAQVINTTDTIALKEDVTRAYKKIRYSSSMEIYNDFLIRAEKLYPMIGNKKTLAFWLSKTYYDLSKKYDISTAKTDYNYSEIEVRKGYLLKSKLYLEEYLGYNDENFKEEYKNPKDFDHIKYALQSLEQKK